MSRPTTAPWPGTIPATALRLPGPLLAAFVAVMLGLLAEQGTAAAQVLGKKPGYFFGGPSPVANEAAMTKRIWSPGLDDGFVPQGVAFADGHLLLSAYRSTDPKVGSGPCRVFRVEAATGADAGQFDLPSDCEHAGGMAYLGGDELLVADTRTVYRVRLSKALADKSVEGALLARVKLGGAVKGSFATWDGKRVWLGSWEREADKARLHAFDPATLAQFNGKGTLREEYAAKAIAIGVRAQGAAFDREGSLWVSYSSSTFGSLQRLDPDDGRVLDTYPMPIGIEDLAFDAEGGLWAVSEAGAQRWSRWSEQFPLLFRLDVTKLER